MNNTDHAREQINKYIRDLYIDYGDLNDKAEMQLRAAVEFGFNLAKESKSASEECATIVREKLGTDRMDPEIEQLLNEGFEELWTGSDVGIKGRSAAPVNADKHHLVRNTIKFFRVFLNSEYNKGISHKMIDEFMDELNF